jgi:glycosyltransferase involved in cell wall biosynthesis
MNLKIRPRVALISIHPAPYRDPVLQLLYEREKISLEVYLLFNHDKGHSYWEMATYSYPKQLMPYRLFLGEYHFSPQVIQSIHYGNYDVVAIPGYYHPTCQLALLDFLCRRKPIIFITDSFGFIPRPLGLRLVETIPFWLLSQIVKAAWVPGSAARNYLKQQGIPDEHIFEGAYCLDVEKLVKETTEKECIRNEIRQQLNLEGRFVLLMVAGFTTNRGLPILYTALNLIRDEFPEITLLLVGNGPEYVRIQKLIQVNNFYKQICLVGPVSFQKLPEFFVASDIYVHSSINEPYSLALSQAAISARPIISTDRVGAAYDYVIEGKTGYFAKAGDAASLAAAMRKLMLNRESLSQMGHLSQQIALRRNAVWAADQFEQAVFTALDRKLK